MVDQLLLYRNGLFVDRHFTTPIFWTRLLDFGNRRDYIHLEWIGIDILGMWTRGIRTTHDVFSGFLIQGSRESGVESLHCTRHDQFLQLRPIRCRPSGISTVSKVKKSKYREGQFAFLVELVQRWEEPHEEKVKVSPSKQTHVRGISLLEPCWRLELFCLAEEGRIC